MLLLFWTLAVSIAVLAPVCCFANFKDNLVLA